MHLTVNETYEIDFIIDWKYFHKEDFLQILQAAKIGTYSYVSIFKRKFNYKIFLNLMKIRLIIIFIINTGGEIRKNICNIFLRICCPDCVGCA